MGCTASRDGKALPEDVYCKSPAKTTGAAAGATAMQENGSVPATDMSDEYFSQHQKRLLRDTWKVIGTDQQSHGIQIFQYIFKRKPETKNLFPFGKLEGDELLHNVMFRSHAKRFMNAVDTTIQNLDALDVALIPVLLKLGEQHVSISGFHQEYLTIFMGAILDVVSDVLGKRCTNQVRDAWGQLANFISEKMEEGYNNAKPKQSPVKMTKNQTSTQIEGRADSQGNDAQSGDITNGNVAQPVGVTKVKDTAQGCINESTEKKSSDNIAESGTIVDACVEERNNTAVTEITDNEPAHAAENAIQIAANTQQTVQNAEEKLGAVTKEEEVLVVGAVTQEKEVTLTAVNDVTNGNAEEVATAVSQITIIMEDKVHKTHTKNVKQLEIENPNNAKHVVSCTNLEHRKTNELT